MASACGDDMWHLPSPFNMGVCMRGVCMCMHAMCDTYGDDMDVGRNHNPTGATLDICFVYTAFQGLSSH